MFIAKILKIQEKLSMVYPRAEFCVHLTNFKDSSFCSHFCESSLMEHWSMKCFDCVPYQVPPSFTQIFLKTSSFRNFDVSQHGQYLGPFKNDFSHILLLLYFDPLPLALLCPITPASPLNQQKLTISWDISRKVSAITEYIVYFREYNIQNTIGGNGINTIFRMCDTPVLYATVPSWVSGTNCLNLCTLPSPWCNIFK